MQSQGVSDREDWPVGDAQSGGLMEGGWQRFGDLRQAVASLEAETLRWKQATKVKP